MDDFGNELPALTALQVNERFDKGSERMAAIERELGKTRQELHELKQQLADLLEFFGAMKGAFKVLHWLGRLAKPVAYIVMLGTACLGFWTAVRAGGGGR